ncbi:DUF305 domain-containing protein [Paractinoplanes atraurantiacus]|uniref:Uncharacterized conserved protein, DUF305 family n=1 Tax=Paractinoplanes atraurantiacus TaxID=1036182 RepID=A0A285FGM6_9ACTN|nr:DUF305 domain-containing protein [Actinoplanes atraurantiacus]SNY09934.1 Uncharacterized conserved protein, DUF305 family [Actinoplanes atraurantiacus]
MPVTTDQSATVAAPISSGGGRRVGLWWLVATLALGLALGLGGGVLIPRLTHPGDDSVEAGFLRDMSTHHAQAVEMSMIAHADSADSRIVTLSGDIALTQHGQIGYMQAWLRNWGLSPTSSQEPMAWMPDSAGSVVNGLMPGMATPEQLAKLREAKGKDLDIQFLTLMRQHHLGGIHMAQEILKLSDNKDVTWLAQTMVTGQQSEIALIDQLLKSIQAS